MSLITALATMMFLFRAKDHIHHRGGSLEYRQPLKDGLAAANRLKPKRLEAQA